MIPKIIHQIAPSDRSRWHPLWTHYQNSWKKNFSDFKFILWNDNELNDFIKSKYRWFYNIYQNYNENIKRIDSARYFLLYEYGGMYIDMDYECINNFWNNIQYHTVSIAETGNLGVCKMENALMISPKRNSFWPLVFSHLIDNQHKHVFEATGPILIQNCIENYNQENSNNNNTINILNRSEYSTLDRHSNKFAIHHQTGVWLKKEKKFEKIFTDIYKNNIWSNNNITEYYSGVGSEIDYNKEYIDFIHRFSLDNQIQTIIDVGCGNFKLMCDGVLKNLDISYIGYDTCEDLISFNKKNNTKNNVEFIKLDIFTYRDQIKCGDLLLCKDVLQHWDDESVLEFLEWLKTSQRFKYILITNCRSEFGFSSIGSIGGWRGLDENHPLFINKKFTRVLTYNTKATLLWSSQND